MQKKPKLVDAAAGLRRRAELRLSRQQTKKAPCRTVADNQRQLHELEVHQIELEMQNAELQKSRNELEMALENYTDLYDFAPVGYFTLVADGAIQKANLTGASLVGIERSRLVGRSFGRLVAVELRPAFNIFLKQVFAGWAMQSGDFELLSQGKPSRIVNIEAQCMHSGQECRAAVMDITERKRAEIALQRLEVLAASNRKLEQEIVQRKAVEKSLKQSQQKQSESLEKACHMQEQLRYLSRQVLTAQEEERKRISRELHDVIAQTLTGINVHLALLKKEAEINTKGIGPKIAGTQRLVEESLHIVHSFARELRPTILDDLGLIPALHSFTKSFAESTGIRIHLKVIADVEKLDSPKRTILYRVAQEALANVARHAKASRVDVSILKLSRAICLTIKDDGKSFQVERILHAKKNKRLGLIGMRERVEMVGGSFAVESAPGKGTTIHARIPFNIRTKKQAP